MARPTDWYVLDLSSDPVPGDPSTISDVARRWSSVADDADTARTQIIDNGTWVSFLPGGAAVTDTLRRLGFFHELPTGMPDGGSLADSLRDAAGANEDEVITYLRSGSVLAASSKRVSDVLSGDPTPVVTLQTLTDGTWIWPSDLAYYVERYHVELPPEFVAQAVAREGRAPQLSQDELLAAEARV